MGRHLVDFREQMAREHDGHAVRSGQIANERAHLVHPGGIEAVHRLVEQQQLTLPEQREREAKALLHAKGVRADEMTAPILETGEGQHTVDLAPRRVQDATGDLEVLAARQVGIERLPRSTSRLTPRTAGRPRKLLEIADVRMMQSGTTEDTRTGQDSVPHTGVESRL